MSINKYFNFVDTFKNKLSSLNEQLKKLKALKNYGEATDFKHRNYVLLLETCTQDHFLTTVEENFLNYMVQKYHLDYLEWCHKTPWLKNHMRLIQTHRQVKAPVIYQPSLFDLTVAHRSSLPVAMVEKMNRKPLGMRIT